VIVGLIIAGLMVVAALFATFVLGRDKMALALYPLAIVASLAIVNKTLTAILASRLQFRVLAVCQSVNSVLSQLLTAIMASRGWGLYSLTVSTAIAAVVFFALLLFLSRITFRPVSTHRWFPILSTSTKLMPSRLLQALAGWGDYVIVASLTNEAGAGTYYFAFTFTNQISNLLGTSVASVLIPSFASIRQDSARLRSSVLEAGRVLSVLVAACAGCQFALAPAVLHSIYGTKWLSAVPMIQIMTIALIVNIPAWPTGSMLLALQRYGDMLRLWGLNIVVFALLLIGGTLLGGALGAAVGSSLYYAISGVGGFIIAMRNLAPVKTYLETVWIGVPASIGAVAIVMLLGVAVPASRTGSTLHVLIGIPTFFAVYWLLIRITRPLQYARTIERIKKLLPTRTETV
jgi:O-antigen/teichoic acid export membrane protein